MKSISLRNRGSLASSRLQAKRVRIPVHIVEASQGSPNNGQSTNSPTEAFNLLEGFFLGRAFAQTLNERLGSVAADIFSEFAKADAERREQMRAFQEEVRARARQEMQASAAPGSVLPGSGGGQAATANGNGAGMTGGAPVSLPRGMNEMRKPMEPKVPDLGEVTTNTRAEVAAARTALRSLKSKN